MLTSLACLILGTGLVLADDAASTDSAPTETLKPIPKAKFTNAGHTVDKVKDVQEFVKSKQAVLLDVREQDEWDAGRLTLAKLVPLSMFRKGDLPEKFMKKLPKDKPIYLHCRSGGRVLLVAEILKLKGYDIRPLRSGYEKLLAAGFDKAKSKDEKKKAEVKKTQ